MPKKFQTWQFWRAAKKLLGEPFLLNVMGRRNGRTIRMYSADPRYAQDRCRDPLEHLHIIFSELDTYGRGDVARRAISYLSSALDDTGDEEVMGVADLLPTLNAEILADYQAVSALQQAVAAGEDIEEVRALASEAREEIDRTVAKYAMTRAD